MIIQISTLTVSERINIIRSLATVSASSYPDSRMYNFLDICDDIARAYLRIDMTNHITNSSVVTVGTDAYDVNTVNAELDGINTLLQWSNRMAVIFILTGINSEDDDEIITFNRELQTELLQGFNNTLDFASNTSITQIRSEGKGTFG